MFINYSAISSKYFFDLPFRYANEHLKVAQNIPNSSRCLRFKHITMSTILFFPVIGFIVSLALNYFFSKPIETNRLEIQEISGTPREDLKESLKKAYQNFNLNEIKRIIPQMEKKILDDEKLLFIAIENKSIEFIELLLANGADPNITKNKQTPFYIVCKQKFSNWEKIAILLLDYKANPCIPYDNSIAYGFFDRFDDNHIVKARLLKDWNLEITDFLFSRHVTTLWGIKCHKKIANEQIFLKGSNRANYIYKLIKEMFNDFAKNDIGDYPIEGINLSDEQFLKTSHEILDFALKINNSEPNELDQLVQDIKKSEIPVLFPTGWRKHSASIIFFRNYIIRCNLNVKEMPGLIINKYNPEKLTKEILEKLIKSPKIKLKSTKDFFYDGIVTDLEFDINNIFLRLNPQVYSNCTWSSSAFLGFIGAIFISNIRIEELDSIDSNSLNATAQIFKQTFDFCDRFEEFAKYYVLKKYLNNHKKLRQKYKIPNDMLILKRLLLKCSKKTIGQKNKYLTLSRKLIKATLKN